jgi:FkbM family methyltransferase
MLNYGSLVKSYLSLFLYGLRHSRATWDDLYSLIFAIIAPVFYLVNFKGELKTPIGRLLVTNREVLRSFTYGFFKTHVTYKRFLKSTHFQNSFFPVVIDVGANIGDFTLMMRNHSGKIIAIEPGHENFSALVANLQINGVQNVIPLRIAAHDQNEEVFLDGQSSNLYISKENSGQSAQASPIDLILKKLGVNDVDVIKIDVQGHERAVLAGMHDSLISGHVKLLIIEVHLKRDVSINDITSLMKRYPYHLIYKDDFLYEQPHLYFKSNTISHAHHFSD